jgi:hypothetical protein
MLRMTEWISCGHGRVNQKGSRHAKHDLLVRLVPNVTLALPCATVGRHVRRGKLNGLDGGQTVPNQA